MLNQLKSQSKSLFAKDSSTQQQDQIHQKKVNLVVLTSSSDQTTAVVTSKQQIKQSKYSSLKSIDESRMQSSQLDQPTINGDMVELLSQQQQTQFNDVSASSMQQVRFQDFMRAQNTGSVNANDPIPNITNRTTVYEIRNDVSNKNNYSPLRNIKILGVQNKNVNQFNNATTEDSYEQEDSILSVQEGNPDLDTYQKQFANAKSHQFKHESPKNQNQISVNHRTVNDGYSSDNSIIAVAQKNQNQIQTKEYSMQHQANSSQFGYSKQAFLDILEDRKSKEYRVQNYDEANKLHQILNGHKDLTETFLGPSKKVQNLKKRVLRAEKNKNSSIERDKKLHVVGRPRKAIKKDKLSSSFDENKNNYVDNSLENISKPSQMLQHIKANSQKQQIGSRHPLHKQSNWDSGATFGSEMRRKSQERIEKLNKMAMGAKSNKHHVEQQNPQQLVSKVPSRLDHNNQLGVQSTNLDQVHKQDQSPFLTEGIESQRAIITIKTSFNENRKKSKRGDGGVHVSKTMTDQYSDVDINKLVETDSNKDLQAALNMYDKSGEDNLLTQKTSSEIVLRQTLWQSGENNIGQPAPFEDQIEIKLDIGQAAGPPLQKESFLLAVVGDEKYVLATNSSSKIQNQKQSFMLNGVPYGNRKLPQKNFAVKSNQYQVAQTKGVSYRVSSRQLSEGHKKQLLDDIGAMQQYGDLALQNEISRKDSIESTIETNLQSVLKGLKDKKNDYGNNIARIETPENEDQVDGQLIVSTARAKSSVIESRFLEEETPYVVDEEENGISESAEQNYQDARHKQRRQTIPATPSKQSLAPMSSSSLKSIIFVKQKSTIDSRSVLGKSNDLSIKDLQQNQQINQEVDSAIDQPNETELANEPLPARDIIEMPDISNTNDVESEIMKTVLHQTQDQRADIEGLSEKDDVQEVYHTVDSNQRQNHPISMNKTMGFKLSQKFPQARNNNFSSMHKLQNQMNKDEVDQVFLDLKKQEQSEYIAHNQNHDNLPDSYSYGGGINRKSLGNNSIRTELLSVINVTATKIRDDRASSEFSNDDDSTSKLANDYQREQLLISKNGTIDDRATNELSNFNLQAKIQYKVTPKHGKNRSDAQAQASRGLIGDQTTLQQQPILEKRVSAIKLPTIQNSGDFFPAFNKDIQESEPAFKNLSKLITEKEKTRFYEKNKQIAQNILNQIGEQQNISPQRRSLSPHINLVTVLDPQTDNFTPIVNLELTQKQQIRQRFISDEKEQQTTHQQQQQQLSSFSLNLKDVLSSSNNGQQDFNKYHLTMREMDRNNTYNHLGNDPQNVIRHPQFQMTSFRAAMPSSNQGAAPPLMSSRQYLQPNLPQVKEESLTKQQRKMNALMNLKEQISRKAEMSSMVHLSEPLLDRQSQNQSQTQRQLKESESQILSYRHIRGHHHNRNHSIQIDNMHQYNNYSSNKRNNSHFGVFDDHLNSFESQSRFATSQPQPYEEKARQSTQNNYQQLQSDRGLSNNGNPIKTNNSSSKFLLQAAKQNLKHMHYQQKNQQNHKQKQNLPSLPQQPKNLQYHLHSSISHPSQVVVVYNNDYANLITQQHPQEVAATVGDNNQINNNRANLTLYPKHITNATTESTGSLGHENIQHHGADRYNELGPQSMQNNSSNLDIDGNDIFREVQPTNISVITKSGAANFAAIKNKHASRRGNSVDRVVLDKSKNSQEFHEDSKKRIDTNSSGNSNENNVNSKSGAPVDDQKSLKNIRVGKQQYKDNKALTKLGPKQATHQKPCVPVNQFPILVVDQRVVNAASERQLKSYRQRILNKRNSSHHQVQPLPILLVQTD